MIEKRVQDGDGGSDEVEEHFPQFVISQEQALQSSRSLPLMIVGRLSNADKQAFEQEPKPEADIKGMIDRISSSSSNEPDYLLPDTPLKEAIFRVLLANRNEPMTAEEISELLSERWAMTAYPRDVSPQVIQRLLENSFTYGIVKVLEPGEEEEEEESFEEPESEPTDELAEDEGTDSADESDSAEETDESES